MHNAQEVKKRLPITFQNFVVTDPCNDLYMGINSQGTSREAKLAKKKRSGSTGDQARRDPDSGECDSDRNVDEI